MPRVTSYVIVAPNVVAGQAESEAVLRLPRLSVTRVVILLAALLVGYFIFAAVGDTLLSQRLDRDEQGLRQEIAELQSQGARLEAIRDYLRTEEYIEGVARRVLGLVRPGETLIIVSSSATPTPAAEQQPSEEDNGAWWEKLYGP